MDNTIRKRLKNGRTIEISKQWGKYKVSVVSKQNAELSTKYSTDIEQAKSDVKELKERYK